MPGRPDVEGELERRLEELGFELVDAVWAGSARRPILRVRIDLPQSEPGSGVTVDDCARVSRSLEPWLDEHEEVSERYVLEISSPGVERPLVRPRYWIRFAGREVALKGHRELADRGKRLRGTLLGLDEGQGEEPRARLRLAEGEEVQIPLEDIADAHLIFDWE
jgi:ribosome maturation factor RimP